MEDIDNFKGYLLAAHPKRQDPILRKGVILIIDHDHNGSIGLQINKPMDNNTTFNGIMHSLGIPYDKERPVYFGGPENTNRIIVLHSLDWQSPGTTAIGENFGISNDLSVLTAISSNQGPELFRAVAGYYRWLPGQLENEIDNLPPFGDVTKGWSIMPANIDLLFGADGSDQWHYAIEENAKNQIATWF